MNLYNPYDPSKTPFHVYLARAQGDYLLADRVHRILDHMGMRGYMYEHYPHPGRRAADAVLSALRDSAEVAVFLTDVGAGSAWVHQELGAAIAMEIIVNARTARRFGLDVGAAFSDVEGLCPPIGVTTASVSSACATSGSFIGASHSAQSPMATPGKARSAMGTSSAETRRARTAATRSSSAASSAIAIRKWMVSGV